jgi:tetratricopeptide (TPR) repeat protein
MAQASPARGNAALRGARVRFGYSQAHAADMFVRTAKASRIPMQPDVQGLRGTISRWENGHQIPDELARRVLRIMYSATDTELGFTSEAVAVVTDSHDEELAARLASATRVDATLVAALAVEVEALRHQDRTFGAALLSERMSGLVNQLVQLMDYSLTPDTSIGLAAVLADAATLAGWQAVDTGTTVRAWGHFTTATHAARIAGSNILLAHAVGERAYAILQTGDAATARATVTHALTLDFLSPRVQAWLHAASAEFAAADNARDDALRAFDHAATALPTRGSSDGDSPFILLDQTHLTRWRGSTLARLADPDALQHLTAALNAPQGSNTARGAAGLHTDLATAHATLRDREQALHHLREAERLARQIGSQRLQARLLTVRGQIPG